MTTSITLVALDLDGTLVDSIGDLAAAANAMREDLGCVPLPQAVLESYVGGGMARLVHRALTDSRHGEVDPDTHDKGMAAFDLHYTRLLTATTRPYPGVESGLALLQSQGIQLACITNKPYRFSVPILEQTGLASYFSLVLGGDSLPEKKPSALPLLHACAHFGLPASQLLMVGDSHYDLDAARAANARCALFDYGYEDIGPLSPDLKATSLVEIAEFVKNANSTLLNSQ
ncbi:phosphoglycolate phosphatase [Burkholderiaceae bacterium DAT-1]|nr:phosphoglycolate phosphatase [Burkholderiaceae bacterium DAT-1]